MRKKIENYSTEELVEYILIRSQDFIPEALSLLKAEYFKREGKIEQFILHESGNSGNIEFIIENVRYSAFRNDGTLTWGNLYLTNKGLYVLPIKAISDKYWQMLFPQIGLLGLILEPLLTSKKNDNMRGTKKLPLSFITKYIKHSYGNDIKNIKFAIFWKPRTIEIHTLDNHGIYFLVDKNNYGIIKSWIDKHDIQFNIGKGLIEKLIGKLKRKTKE